MDPNINFGQGQGLMPQQPQGQMDPRMMQMLMSGASPQQASDPQSVYLMQALQAMQGGGQQGIKSPMALDTNMLADALDRYGLHRRGQQLGIQNQNLLGSVPGAQPGLDQAFNAGISGG